MLKMLKFWRQNELSWVEAIFQKVWASEVIILTHISGSDISASLFHFSDSKHVVIVTLSTDYRERDPVTIM